MESHRQTWRQSQYYWQPEKEARRFRATTKHKQVRRGKLEEHNDIARCWTKVRPAATNHVEEANSAQLYDQPNSENMHVQPQDLQRAYSTHTRISDADGMYQPCTDWLIFREEHNKEACGKNHEAVREIYNCCCCIMSEGQEVGENHIHVVAECHTVHGCCTGDLAAIESELYELWTLGVDPTEYTQENPEIRKAFTHDLITPGTGPYRKYRAVE